MPIAFLLFSLTVFKDPVFDSDIWKNTAGRLFLLSKFMLFEEVWFLW